MNTVTDIDRGWAKVVAAANSMENLAVYVGVHSDAVVDTSKQTTRVAKGRPRKTGQTITVAEYASKNEYGIGVPKRPFMRVSFDNNQAKYQRVIDRLSPQITDGKITVRKALELLGQTCKSEIQKTIVDAKNWAQPNSPAWIAEKGSSSPLIDTGRMRQSIRAWVGPMGAFT